LEQFVKFLIIDDNSADRELAIRRLRRDFPQAEFIEVGREREFEEVFARGGFDIVITDYEINWTNGLLVLEAVKERYPGMPVVMVTGTGNEEIAVEGMRGGLSNYLLKKHLERLPFAVKESLERARLHRQYEDTLERLRRSEERYRDIFEHSLTGIFIFAPAGELLSCNEAFARIFGFASVTEALQEHVYRLFPTEQAYQNLIERVQRERQLSYHEVELRRCDGEPLLVMLNASGAFAEDHGERLVEVRGFLFDITERHRLEAQILQAQKMESLGLLVSGIAHDFNNMLGGIIGHADRALGRVSQNHPLHHSLSRIRDIATHGARVTRQLLAFSRRQVLEPCDLDLNDVVSDMLNFLGKVLDAHIEIAFNPGADLKAVHADSTQLEQVLINLCINARDAMPDGGKLLIETANVPLDSTFSRNHPDVQSGEYVLLSVKDSGIGMDEKTRVRIFEPFFTTKGLDRGTGLGLSMVHGIVGQHNGLIDVESMPGQGTTFNIYLPAVEGGVVHKSQEEVQEQVAAGKETLLLVEDDDDLRFLMEDVLQEYGYIVISASNGQEGLELFRRAPQTFSLVVSDMVTPRMRGQELRDRVREIRPEIRFLFVSGYLAEHLNRNFVLDEGINFLQKPFDLVDLIAKVRDILERDEEGLMERP
jgi:PAS domain S-box-containing protein